MIQFFKKLTLICFALLILCFPAREELPYVTVVTTEVDLTVGDNKDLKCVAAGVPRPTFQWHKEENSTPLLPDNVS